MLFFKRILEKPKEDTPTDRRVAPRYAVNARFPVKSILNIVGRDDQGHPLKTKDGMGWDWVGKLINLSASGARLQVPPTVVAERGDPCLLKIDIQGYQLLVPGQIAHVAERRGSLIFGLALEVDGPEVKVAYRQLLELVALGASLKNAKPLAPDASGYLVEQYDGDGSRLTVWRQLAGREVAAFEFLLRDWLVRGLADRQGLDFLVGTEAATAHKAPPTQIEEILRLYQWVVLNLPADVPADVREFLLKQAA